MYHLVIIYIGIGKNIRRELRMVWSKDAYTTDIEKDLMRKLDDDEIIIGDGHPMRYAFSILVLLHKRGVIKVYVNKKRNFECKYTHITKSVKDRWQEVKKFVIEIAEVKELDKKESEYYEVVTLTW
jgi:hypothetical protein